jgi:hypothetical protein
MQYSQLILGYVQALAWPCVAVFLLLRYRSVIESLVPHSRLKFTIAGITIETSLETMERSVEESFGGRRLLPEQWAWLRRLASEGRLACDPSQHKDLRPLRNAGLLKVHPEGWLATAKEVEITTLGRLLLEAHDKTARNP